jgi:uncharacterized protein
MHFAVIPAIAQLDAAEWDNLFDSDYPFCQYAFLHALEQGGSVNVSAVSDVETNANELNTGWLVQHLTLRHNDKLIAVMPAYIKLHSYGEYLFDWQFAKAYQQYGLTFYPKLINAIPFTPTEGPRIAVARGYDKAAILAAFSQGIQQLTERLSLSQFQVLYPNTAEQQLYRQLACPNGSQPSRYHERLDVQFQWHNRDYTNFDDFLQQLTSRKRKQIRQERNRVAEQGVMIKVLTAEQLNPQFWQQFYQFYATTYLKRSGHQGYLSQETFLHWGSTMAKQIVVFAAEYQGEMVAAALCFRDSQHLYGRYWGCKAEFDRLHFECCYYAGIDYCIEHKLTMFDAGAQGEHKVQRGFEPVIRSGFYQFQPNALTSAIEHYIVQEQAAVTEYFQQVQQQLPFKA